MKGKAVAMDLQTSRNSSNSTRRHGSTRSSQSRRLGALQIPSESTSAAAAAAAGVHANAETSHGQGSSRRGGSNGRLRREGQEDGRESNDEEVEEGELSPTIAPRATGFDRLREAGFSEDDIRSIRRQFHASRGTITVGENGFEVGPDQDEDARERARRVEEEWIDQHGSDTLPEGCNVEPFFFFFFFACPFYFRAVFVPESRRGVECSLRKKKKKLKKLQD